MLGASDLPIGLAPLNDSGVSGIAWLHDNGDGSTSVYAFLTRGRHGGGWNGPRHGHTRELDLSRRLMPRWQKSAASRAFFVFRP